MKINNWSISINPDASFSCANLNTLKLYDGMINDYWKLYQSMKAVYWDRFSPIWKDLTNTDPEKFIYEDIHIACYLILAWRHLKTNVKCFVDLGCGNGLLVYILNDQGLIFLFPIINYTSILISFVNLEIKGIMVMVLI